jgi:hypothetical protein
MMVRTRLAVSVVVVVGSGLGLAATAAGAATSQQQVQFVKNVRFLDPNAQSVSKKTILGLGNQVCRDLNSGTSVKKLAGILKGSEKAVLVEATTVLCPKYKAKVASYYATTTTTKPPAQASTARTVRGTAATLSAGNFKGGTDVAVGLYDVTAGPGQEGNFTVMGGNDYNEILGSDTASGAVPEIRVQISSGDQIQISGLSQVIFTPVTTPYVTTHTGVNLYAGTWTVGQDLGPGRYIATPAPNESGNFVIENEGVNEILGGDTSSGDVPNVTFTVKKGDVISVSGLSQVMLSPA